MEASRDLIVIPGTRGHEYVRVSENGIRAKVGVDATVPFEEKDRFTRCEFEPVPIDRENISMDPKIAQLILGG
jgi:2,5-furandicarboxylate decarboxylase 1